MCFRCLHMVDVILCRYILKEKKGLVMISIFRSSKVSRPLDGTVICFASRSTSIYDCWERRKERNNGRRLTA